MMGEVVLIKLNRDYCLVTTSCLLFANVSQQSGPLVCPGHSWTFSSFLLLLMLIF